VNERVRSKACRTIADSLYRPAPASLDIKCQDLTVGGDEHPHDETPGEIVARCEYRHELNGLGLNWSRMPTPKAQKRNGGTRQLSPKERDALLSSLKARFEKNMNRHRGLQWAAVQARLEANPERLWSLHQMEQTGGEPDVVGQDKKTGEYVFFDCSAESPKGRRSVCYDREALDARKEHKPKTSALDMAAEMGIEILTEEQYRHLQTVGEFDTKTSSWVKTPPAIRERGGAIFCDRRYDHVFMYHNGAESYYAARAFRGALKV
jgi:hypothetical protein